MDIDSLVSEIHKSQNDIQELAAQMTDKVCKVEKPDLNLSVCAVDGGLLAHRMHGVDITVARAAGVHFAYENSKIKKFDHHPSKVPKSSVELMSALDEHEANVFRSLVRLKHEIKCANELATKYSPDILLLDGSLLPVPSDIPAKESKLYPLYQQVLSQYEKLYSSKCLFAGVIKDSRARRFSDKCSDSVLCDHLLKPGERTVEMDYSVSPKKDLEKKIKFFYIKPSKSDIPLRIEVLGDVNEAAKIIYSLSAISDHFAYPAILIEADMCAALDPAHIESIEASLQSKAGLSPLRRNFRPFR